MAYLRIMTFLPIFLVACNINLVKANTEYSIAGHGLALDTYRVVLLKADRFKRDTASLSTTPLLPTPPSAAPAPQTPSNSPAAPAPVASAPLSTNSTPATSDANRTINVTNETPTATVTQIPLLGYDTSIRRYDSTNSPKVSDPIIPDDNFTDVYKTPEKIQAERNLTNLTRDHHTYYNSTFIGNKTYFDEYWANITAPLASVHPILSDSHRRAAIMKLKFKFPFYGHMLNNVTIATGGFIFTGDQVHTWLAATQYIAPLMANFDTTLTNDSFVKLYEDDEKLTTLWENVSLQEEKNKTFTFAVTLHKNGDIVFAYKDVPIPVENITDREHPVKVGISDAYLTHNYVFYVRQKTIFEYHRVSFKGYEISNNTILKLIALPTCPLYETCDSCINHKTNFNCTWCEQIKKCSAGTDRNKQEWVLRHCDKLQVTSVEKCGTGRNVTAPESENTNTAYTTDGQTSPRDATILNTTAVDVTKSPPIVTQRVLPPHDTPHHWSMGGAIAAVVLVTLVFSFVAWTIYAFKNPHTRSGQMLIKYRPSQWSWRRGEARYTAATIHM